MGVPIEIEKTFLITMSLKDDFSLKRGERDDGNRLGGLGSCNRICSRSRIFRLLC